MATSAAEDVDGTRSGRPRGQGQEGRRGHGDGQDWDRRYAATARLFSAEPDPALVALAGSVPVGRALDLGAGEGRNSLWLARNGWDVTAVDVSAVALGRLAEAASAQGSHVRTVVGDMQELLTSGERYDLVVVCFIHPAPDRRASLLAGMAGAVAPGGDLFVAGHHLVSLGMAGPPDPDRLYTEDRVRDAFPSLRTLRLERRQRTTADGQVIVDLLVWAVQPPGMPQ